MSKDKKPENVMAMTASTIGADLLQALVQEIKLLPDLWVKMSQKKQDDVIERLRKRVTHNVQMATHLIASDGRITVVAELEQITLKDGIKAVLTMSKNDPNRHALMDAQGKTVLVALADAEAHMGEVAAVKGEADQRAMDLGHEYDPNGDGKGMDDSNVVDAEFKALPDSVLQADLDAAYQDGRRAAEEGKPKSSCPTARHEIVAAWTQGYADYFSENPHLTQPADDVRPVEDDEDPSAETGDGGAA